MSKLLIHEDKTGEIAIQDKLSEDFLKLLNSESMNDILFIVKGEDNNVEKIAGKSSYQHHKQLAINQLSSIT
jgi:hypothetical protein